MSFAAFKTMQCPTGIENCFLGFITHLPADFAPRIPPIQAGPHSFEGPDWQHLKRGRESFARGPIVKVDPQQRCAVVLENLKAAQSFVQFAYGAGALMLPPGVKVGDIESDVPSAQRLQRSSSDTCKIW
ncbi:hypothetical protein ACH5RR_010758 [Cinchona calisaya]|uniref:Uncharacterized protein n=1 Tax=Cinchona calisaya TaxID=153742 RepID=A0ABD3AJT1_9GENT